MRARTGWLSTRTARSSGRQSVAVFEPRAASPALTDLATGIGSNYFNATNDVVVRTDGTIYFTDPTYHQGAKTPYLPYRGVYRIAPSRTAAEAFHTSTTLQPNGITLSLDERTLYMSDSAEDALYTFQLSESGTFVSGPTPFATGVTITVPDGTAMDCAGNIYWASKTGGYVRVISPGGTSSLTISVSGVTNLAFGGADRKTLFLTAGHTIYAQPMNLPGLPY
jgi:gluconolactonase